MKARGRPPSAAASRRLRRRPRGLRLAAGVARAEWLRPASTRRSTSPPARRSASSIRLGLAHEMRKSASPWARKRAAACRRSDESGSRHSRAGRAEEARPHRHAGAFAEEEDTGDGQAAADDIRRQSELRLPVAPHREQRRIWPPAEWPPTKSRVGSPPNRRSSRAASRAPRAISDRGRKHMRRREAIADAGEDDAGAGKDRRHERHPLLDAVGPAAAMDEGEYRAVRPRRRIDCEALIGIAAIGDLLAIDPAPRRVTSSR